MIEIPLTQGYVAIIDDEDAHLAAHKWFASRAGRLVYAKRNRSRKEQGPRSILLHREVLGISARLEIGDHIDGNTLDCRRSNLRVVTQERNLKNRSEANTNNATGSLGVCRVGDSGLYRAYIFVGGKQVNLGRFESVAEAVSARVRAERDLWGIEPRRAQAHG